MSKVAVDSVRPKRPKTGGRIKGTPNRKTRLKRQAVVNALIAETLSPSEVELLQPLEVLLRIMRSRVLAGDDVGALVAAQAAAPFCHARLSSSDVRITNATAALSDTEIAEEMAALRAKFASVKLLS